MSLTEQDTVPDLTLYLLIHQGMRTDFARLVDVVDSSSDGDPRLAHLGRWYRGFLAEFVGHHTVEDEIFFPAVLERVPVSADTLAQLGDEHHVLDKALRATGEAIAELAATSGTGAAAFAAVRADAVAQLTDTKALLTSHLDVEDDDVLPLFVRHFTAAEYDALDDRAIRHKAFTDLKFTVSWVMSHAEGDVRAHLLQTAPLGMKLLWYATRRGYRRSVQRAFGGAAAPTSR